MLSAKPGLTRNAPPNDSGKIVQSLDDYLLLLPRLAFVSSLGLGVALLALIVNYLENNVFYFQVVVPGIKIPWSAVFIAGGILFALAAFLLPFIAEPLDRWLAKDDDDKEDSKTFAQILREVLEEKKKK